MTDELVKNLILLVIAAFTGVNTTILWSIRDRVMKHEQSLYGANGDNGLQSDMKLVRERTHEHLSHITEHKMRISLLEEDRHRGSA